MPTFSLAITLAATIYVTAETEAAAHSMALALNGNELWISKSYCDIAPDIELSPVCTIWDPWDASLPQKE